jgi:cellulose synthase/poly-beta-1,6-N-acetylglucosamine synthase-like glycosyltransferase
MTTVLEIVFWASLGLLVYTHVGYPAVLWALARGRQAPPDAGDAAERPDVSLIIVAHDEQEVIERKLRNALDLDYPRERLELIVASDGSDDRTVEIARSAGADLVLDLPRAGKIATQNAAAERARGELLAFSDANAFWAPDALARLIAPFNDRDVGYVCGQVRFTADGAANEEGAYWSYEMAVRDLESRLGGVTAGNGAIYATRRSSYIALGPSRSHDLSFPFEMVKRGWRALYAAEAVASEKMVPTIEGEFARKRRMMRGLWDIVISDGMLSPRGYGPAYAFEIASHRLLRYASPLLHVIALAANVALVGQGLVYEIALAAQVAFIVAAILGRFVPLRPLRLAYYYGSVTASIAVGLWDRLRHGQPASWETAEGTR